ncbi:Pentatricopeptide repeat-containing protein [Raphanus sativus]|nr:Pentatricopeptide repeat-containing protein [Raphanus sativus]
MVQEGLELDLLTYTTLIKGLASKGLMVEARQVFDKMLRREIRPDLAVFDLLIRAYEKKGDMAAASELLLDMQTRGLVIVLSVEDCSKQCDSEYGVARFKSHRLPPTSPKNLLKSVTLDLVRLESSHQLGPE